MSPPLPLRRRDSGASATACLALLALAGWRCGPMTPAPGDDDSTLTADDDSAVPAAGVFEAWFFDIGTADATLLVSPEGRSVLVDLGVPVAEAFAPSVSAEHVVDRIRGILGAARVDAFVATHFHTDHVGTFDGGQPTGGLPYAVDVLGLEVGVFLDRGSSPLGDSDTQADYLSWLSGRNHRVIDGPGTDWIDLGPEVVAEVLALPGSGVLSGDPGEIEENNFSLPLRVAHGDLEISLCGDLPGSFTSAWDDGSGEEVLQYQDVESAVAPAMGVVEVLKPDHHGSQSSTNMAWLQAVNPAVAIYSLGRNAWGYPHEYTWDRLASSTAARGGRLFRTGDERGDPVDGEVRVWSEDGRTFVVGDLVLDAMGDADEADLPRPFPELTDESDDVRCADGQDNDGDCYCDCSDWSCSWNPRVTVCAGGSASYCGTAEGPLCDGDREGLD